MTKKRIPTLPKLLQSKIYKTGQTRGADDDVIFQNRVNRNSTVLIPYDFFDLTNIAPDNNGQFENGFIALINPRYYFTRLGIDNEMKAKGLSLGQNALIFYETRQEWNEFNPISKNLIPATSRTNPLGGEFVARVPSTTSVDDEKIMIGFNTSNLKGAGIRVYEYASKEIIKDCQNQLEYLFWHCFDAESIALDAGMTIEQVQERQTYISEICEERRLSNHNQLKECRMMDNDKNTVCPLCLEKLKGISFLNRLVQAEGRTVHDLTVTEVNLFHIKELRIGEFNHRPYNLGWGHHHCNVVCKDSGITETLHWMKMVIDRNQDKGVQF